MKITQKALVVAIFALCLGCKSTFNVNETMQVEENRNAIYQEIISNPTQFKKFISEAQKNEEAKKILMKTHMEQMESGNMKMMMQKNPEMKEKMQSHMQKLMEETPEMKEKMQSKMLDKLMSKEEGREMLLDKIHESDSMTKQIKKRMMKMMDENPEMMKEMMQNMKEKMKEKTEDRK